MSVPGSRRAHQVVFAEMQRHPRAFELGMIVVCILCIVAGVLIAKATDWGVTTRP
jgi:hypothetical protein